MLSMRSVHPLNFGKVNLGSLGFMGVEVGTDVGVCTTDGSVGALMAS